MLANVFVDEDTQRWDAGQKTWTPSLSCSSICKYSQSQGSKRGQNLTVPVGDMNLYLNLNQQFSIICTCRFLFLMK